MKLKITTLALLLILTGCFVTATLQGEPPMVVREGSAPKIALVVHSEDVDVAKATKEKLTACLEKRNVFKFVDYKKVDTKVKSLNLNTDKVYGLKDTEYLSLAQDLQVDYVLFANLAVVKAIKFTGWRKDIYSMFYLHSGKTGKKVNTWRSDTTMTTTDPNSELDAVKMATSVINHTCAKIIEEF